MFYSIENKIYLHKICYKSLSPVRRQYDDDKAVIYRLQNHLHPSWSTTERGLKNTTYQGGMLPSGYRHDAFRWFGLA